MKLTRKNGKRRKVARKERPRMMINPNPLTKEEGGNRRINQRRSHLIKERSNATIVTNLGTMLMNVG
jgi:hypothetical protein